MGIDSSDGSGSISQTPARRSQPSAAAVTAARPSLQPLAAEIHTRVSQVPQQPSQDRPSIELELTSISVRSNVALAPGAVISVELRLSSNAPAITTLARVSSVDAPTDPGAPTTMHLSLLEVWGKRATEQLTEYLTEANGGSQSKRSFSGVRVLVVDDNARYREAAAQVMRDAGFEVILASNGFEALSAALKHHPSVVLTDVTMPGMDGWQLLRMIRARPTLRRTPVLFLTDLNSNEQRTRGYELGVDDYVLKPFTAVELIARVERVLERAQMAEESVTNGMRGDLSKIPVSSLLSFIELERRTGVLQLERAGERATLHLREGAVMRIDLAGSANTLEGIQRFFHVLDWDGGRFELISIDVFAVDSLNVPTSYALLEHARRHDESMENGLSVELEES